MRWNSIFILLCEKQFSPQTSNLKPQSSNLKPQPSTLKTQSSILKTQPSTLNPQTSILNPQTSNLNTQTSILNTQHSTRFMRSTAVACLLQVAQEQGEDQDDGHDNEATFTGWAAVIAVIVRAVIVEGVGVFFGGFVVGRVHWENLYAF